MTTERTASMNPEEMSEGGGLLGSDEPVTLIFKETRFVLWNYNDTQPTKSPALRVLLVDEEGEEHTEYWSAGDAKNWVPSSDGKTLRSAGTVEKVNRGTNTGHLMKSLVDSGYDAALLGSGDVSTLDGMVAVMHQVPAPKRSGLSNTPAQRADGRVFEKTILVAKEIIQMPGERKATPRTRTRSTPAAAKTAPAAASESDDAVVQTKTREAIKAVLEARVADYMDGIPKAELVPMVFAVVKNDKDDRKAIIDFVNDDDFLSDGGVVGEDDALWEYADGVVVLA